MQCSGAEAPNHFLWPVKPCRDIEARVATRLWLLRLVRASFGPFTPGLRKPRRTEQPWAHCRRDGHKAWLPEARGILSASCGVLSSEYESAASSASWPRGIACCAPPGTGDSAKLRAKLPAKETRRLLAETGSRRGIFPVRAVRPPGRPSPRLRRRKLRRLRSRRRLRRNFARFGALL